jgi:hypothetical protein
MKFELELPDSCYREDKESYDRFAGALQLMLNRMATSHNKYQKGGKMADFVPAIDEVKSVQERIAMYSETWTLDEILDGLENKQKDYGTGNTENLLDAANILVIEFLFPKHPKAKFRAQSSHESPGLEYIP